MASTAFTKFPLNLLVNVILSPSASLRTGFAKNPATSKAGFNCEELGNVSTPSRLAEKCRAFEVAGCFASLNSPQDESAVADMTGNDLRLLRPLLAETQTSSQIADS
jgi:hypothetical protein